VLHKGRQLTVSASVGLASYPLHSDTLSGVLKSADLALYAAKNAGKKRARWFEPKMAVLLEERTALKAEMAAALTAKQIVPYYQPKLDLLTGTIVGFEALARWRHPKRGLLTPTVFGSLFEDGEIAVGIGTAILDQMLAYMRAWLAQGLSIGRVAINCSSHEFRLAGFAQGILEALSKADVPPASFEVEVTEGVMLGRDAEAVSVALRHLHQAGVKISLDDFGTGYASLVHLKKFPVDEIKLDRSFVAEMDQAPNPAIIGAIVAMGLSLGLTIVAEGVETEIQAAALREIGCSHGQGYLYGKPMSSGRVPWFIRTFDPARVGKPVRPPARRLAEA